jgi:hypothetical protein
MFIFTWLFDKLGYMPKVTVDTTWTSTLASPQEKPVPKKRATTTRKPRAVAKASPTKKVK